jgi:hypothetical protein
MSHIEDLVQYLSKHTTDPHCLPAASEQVIKDIKGIDYSTIVAFKVTINSFEKAKSMIEFRLDSTIITRFIKFTEIKCLFNK